MKIYWTTKSIPEVAHLSEAERVQAIRACNWKVLQHRAVWVAVGVMFLLACTGQMLGFWSGDTLGYPYRYLLPPIGFLVFTAPGYFTFYRTVFIEQMRPHLREYVEIHFQKQIGA